ncbi:MAG: UvrD-helicase domain-containing protein [Kineosporiaceae bacterium]
MDRLSPPVPFDPFGPLPGGTTVLEASAGTGKTWTIAALAVRHLAEGTTDLGRLALITFGRAATSELRERVRERLSACTTQLLRPDARDAADPLVRFLACVDDAELERRRQRLLAAVARFDTATIATTHGFCQRALAWLGIAADLDPEAVLVGDAADLVEEVVDDLYVQRFADHRPRAGEPPRPSPTVARTVARAAAGDPTAELLPATATAAGHPAGVLVEFARAVRQEVTRRKRERRLLDYDDLVLLLRDALADPRTGPAASARLRERVGVVLVDEFQDTDPLQWEVLRRAFHGHVPLVLIGDPKQAIYAFRGGDVSAYLAAREQADAVATLSSNWRSDAGLVRALGALWRGAALGDERIVVTPVEAARPRPRVSDGPPVRLRRLSRAALGTAGSRLPLVGRVREAVVADVTSVTVDLLTSRRLIAPDGAHRAVEPADIAVLTRRNTDALAVRDSLVAVGIPAVVSGLSSVFASPSATSWLTLLDAMISPGRPGPTAALALTAFVGWDAHRLATATGTEREELARTVADWASVLSTHGVAALAEAVTGAGLAQRLLRTTTGERTLTDLRHVGQELHAAASRAGLGTAALRDWLQRRIRDAAEDYTEERSRRLDTDSAAVQVVTVHAAKGLEFPVVLVPFAWDRYEGDKQAVLRLHDAQGVRQLHVGGPGSPGADEARAVHLAEERGEDLRLLYVALTRACSQVVVWWAPTGNAAAGALTRLLWGERSPTGGLPARVRLGSDADLERGLQASTRAAGDLLGCEVVDEVAARVRWEAPERSVPPLVLGRPRIGLDTGWRRLSYSSLTAAAHEGTYGSGGEGPLVGVGSEPEGAPETDEAQVGPAGEPGTSTVAEAHAGSASEEEPRRVQVPPMADLPGGTGFGTLVHEVLETVDTGAPDLLARLHEACRRAGADRMPGVGALHLAEVLLPVLRTPMGPLADDASLADLAPRDRLTELEFELPLAGGDAVDVAVDGAHAATLADVAALLTARLQPEDPLAPYARRLADAPFATSRLRGYLTGSIDAVLRLPGPRFVVVDYKTNRLAPLEAPLTTEHYLPGPLAAAMMDADYPLQLLLYLTALHRYLRWRLPGYDPQRHLGGGLYLFVRGMCGPDTVRQDGVPAGVFGWRPPAGLIEDLSALLEGRGR